MRNTIFKLVWCIAGVVFERTVVWKKRNVLVKKIIIIKFIAVIIGKVLLDGRR